MKLLGILVIGLAITGCGPEVKVKTTPNELTQYRYTYLGKPLNCIKRNHDSISCDWVEYHKQGDGG